MKIIVTDKELKALTDLMVKVEVELDGSNVCEAVERLAKKENKDNGIVKETYNIENPEIRKLHIWLKSTLNTSM